MYTIKHSLERSIKSWFISFDLWMKACRLLQRLTKTDLSQINSRKSFETLSKTMSLHTLKNMYYVLKLDEF